MIEVENVGKRFGAKVAVDGVSFVAPPGAVTGFVGPNGAGKSTVLRMIAGLTRPNSGRVTGVSAAAAAGLTFARREP